VALAVADDGPGIGEAEKSRVVERFYRGDASRGTPGVGLGLSLAQAVAKLHGCSLELSDRDPGLRVTLRIPPDPAPVAPAAAAAEAPATPGPARLPDAAPVRA
jgi:signal transduction histidine kinase